MNEVTRTLLLKIEHRLTTECGLVVTDKPGEYDEALRDGCDANGARDCQTAASWKLDHSELLAEITAVLRSSETHEHKCASGDADRCTGRGFCKCECGATMPSMGDGEWEPEPEVRRSSEIAPTVTDEDVVSAGLIATDLYPWHEYLRRVLEDYASSRQGAPKTGIENPCVKCGHHEQAHNAEVGCFVQPRGGRVEDNCGCPKFVPTTTYTRSDLEAVARKAVKRLAFEQGCVLAEYTESRIAKKVVTRYREAEEAK